MAAIPTTVVDPVADAIFAHYERKFGAEPARAYLGASAIGNPCARALWYGFRWAKAAKFSGRLYRLFQSGHLQEPRVVDDLRAIGCVVYDVNPATAKQFSFTEPAAGHHFAGNCDGILVGLPQAPKAPHILEVKTSNDKLFAVLQRDGVEKAKPEHYAQMQIYMKWSQDQFGADGCQRALYVSVNKNTDDLHGERVEFDPIAATRLIAKAKAIIEAATQPERLSADPTWYECKFCDYHAICHGTDMPAPTCRSCAHATPEIDGNARWSCANFGADIPTDAQREGCPSHRYIPDLLANFAKPVDMAEGNVTYRMTACGREFVNGDPDANSLHLASKEIAACADKRMLPEQSNDSFIMDMRRNFGGRLVA